MGSKIKLGIFGGGRGSFAIKYASIEKDVEIVAICEKRDDVIAKIKKENDVRGIRFYKDFDEFIKEDLDAVFLANYAHQHAPYAIRCLDKGINVLSEVLPCATIKEAIELIEACERSKAIYAYSENYCFMSAALEMKKKFEDGVLGNFEYGEGEYVHNCEPIWPEITQGNPNHWRNNSNCLFYCTHSVGPLLHISGLRPIAVNGFELPFSSRTARMGAKQGTAGLLIITLNNGAIIKSIHGNLDKNSIWYSIYGSKGRMESAREDAEAGNMETLYTNLDSSEGVISFKSKKIDLNDNTNLNEKEFGHGASDYRVLKNFIQKVKGDTSADTIDVYEAIDMWLTGHIGYYSVLEGNIKKEIPNFRNKEERESYRNDNKTSFKDLSDVSVIPSYSKRELIISDQIYERIRNLFENKKAKK